VLLIVMYETRTWRVNPGEVFTFGRAASSSAVLPSADYALSRRAGSFRFDADCWWVHNESGSALLYLTGDRGFRVDLPPGMRGPRALEELIGMLMSTGTLTSDDLRLLPPPKPKQEDTQPAKIVPIRSVPRRD
jgi:hypothetical protein